MKVKFLFTLLMVSCLCLFLYFFNNKYLAPGTQAANGLLILSDSDLASSPSRYLWNGWSFYPNVLLTPKDLIAPAEPLYMTYTAIGDHTRFDRLGQLTTPHGSGTYVLQLDLPDSPKTYALELPEIFSAYRLYIDDTLVLQLGNPDPKYYVPQTQRHILPFEASGQITLLLAVSDFSHFYSGLIYPPRFGTYDTLLLGHDLFIALILVLTTLFAIFSCLALYLALHIQHSNIKSFTFLCLTMTLFTSYPLLHHYFPLPIQPWYAIEITSGYVVTLLVIILVNQMCSVSSKLKLISTTFVTTITLFSFCYGLFSRFLTVPIMNVYSLTIDCFKLLSAAYLLFVTSRSLKRQYASSSPLFLAATAYSVTLVWDRMLPRFEPIYGGWFTEWGCLCLLLAIAYILWRDLVHAYVYNLTFKEEHRQTERQLAMQLAYSHQLSERIEENRRLTHDFRHHLRTLTGLVDENNSLAILPYIEQLMDTTKQQQHHHKISTSFSSHIAVDALLKYYNALATAHHISITIRLTLPDTLPLTDVAFCTILGNLLENAIEACIRLDSQPRHILLASHMDTNQLFLIIENTYDGLVKREGKHFISRKTTGYRIGVGTASVQTLVTHSGGIIDMYPDEKLFKVSIQLPLTTPSEDLKLSV